MKKIVIIIIVLLLVAGAAGGAYYYFFMMNQDAPVSMNEDSPEPAPMMEKPRPKPQVKPNLDYFVTSDRLNVRSYPNKSAEIRSVLRKGEQVKAIEVKGDWVRISEYEVHISGNDVADWLHTSFLAHEKPVITASEERKSLIALIKKSDDLKQYQESFILGTRSLIESGQCSFEDFELIGGWVKSVTFNIEPVYFVYCGGTKRGDKVYLNVTTGKTFKP